MSDLLVPLRADAIRSGSAAPRIMVVDDHADIREPMTAYLQRCGFEVLTAQDGAQMRAQLDDGAACELILLDVMMPGEDGFSLCRYVQQQYDTPVIMLTAMSATADRVSGLESGADDYVVKPFEPPELLARIRSVLRRYGRTAERASHTAQATTTELAAAHAAAARRTPAPAWRFRFDAWTFDANRRELQHTSGERVDLSAAEYRLLCVLVANPNTVLSREKLLDMASGGDMEVYDRSIDTQVSRLRRKLEVDPRRPRLLKTAWGDGYLFATSVEALA